MNSRLSRQEIIHSESKASVENEEDIQYAQNKLKSLSLASVEQIRKVANNLPTYFNTEYFISECLEILKAPAPTALANYKRLFLNYEIAILSGLNAINSLGQGVLKCDVSFNADCKLVEGFSKLKYEIKNDNISVQVTAAVTNESYKEKNIFNTLCHSYLFMSKLSQPYLKNKEKAQRNKIYSEMANQLIKTRSVISQLIYGIGPTVELVTWEQLMPNRMAYILQLISPAMDFLDVDYIKEIIANISDNDVANETILIKALEKDLKNLVLLLVHSNNKSLSANFIDTLGLNFSENNYTLKKTTSGQPKNYLNLIGICVFMNESNAFSKDLRDETYTENILALEYLLTSIRYCEDYVKLNDQFDSDLNKLDRIICTMQLAAEIKNNKVLSTNPKVVKDKVTQVNERVLDEKEYPQAYNKYVKKYRAYQEKQLQVKLLIQNENVNCRDVFDEVMNTLEAKFNAIPEASTLSEYSQENIDQLVCAQDRLFTNHKELSYLANNINTVINDKISSVNNKFDLILQQLSQAYKDYQHSYSAAVNKFNKLVKHASLPRKGQTNKPLYPDYEIRLDSLKKQAQIVEAALKNITYSVENYRSIEAAHKKMQLMQYKLNTLVNHLTAAEKYFHNSSRLFSISTSSSSTTQVNDNKRSRKLG